jgi:hypothetical protein
MKVLKNQVLKTVRLFNRVLEHMLRGGGEYFLLAPHFARDFRGKYNGSIPFGHSSDQSWLFHWSE